MSNISNTNGDGREPNGNDIGNMEMQKLTLSTSATMYGIKKIEVKERPEFQTQYAKYLTTKGTYSSLSRKTREARLNLTEKAEQNIESNTTYFIEQQYTDSQNIVWIMPDALNTLAQHSQEAVKLEDNSTIKILEIQQLQQRLLSNLKEIGSGATSESRQLQALVSDQIARVNRIANGVKKALLPIEITKPQYSDLYKKYTKLIQNRDRCLQELNIIELEIQQNEELHNYVQKKELQRTKEFKTLAPLCNSADFKTTNFYSYLEQILGTEITGDIEIIIDEIAKKIILQRINGFEYSIEHDDTIQQSIKEIAQKIKAAIQNKDPNSKKVAQNKTFAAITQRIVVNKRAYSFSEVDRIIRLRLLKLSKEPFSGTLYDELGAFAESSVSLQALIDFQFALLNAKGSDGEPILKQDVLEIIERQKTTENLNLNVKKALDWNMRCFTMACRKLTSKTDTKTMVPTELANELSTKDSSKFAVKYAFRAHRYIFEATSFQGRIARLKNIISLVGTDTKGKSYLDYYFEAKRRYGQLKRLSWVQDISEINDALQAFEILQKTHYAMRNLAHAKFTPKDIQNTPQNEILRGIIKQARKKP